MGTESQSRSKAGVLVVATPSAKLHKNVCLNPTSFLRCLACVGILNFHVAWFVILAADDRKTMDEALSRRSWFTFVFSPEPAMHTFMCLTGYELHGCFYCLVFVQSHCFLVVLLG